MFTKLSNFFHCPKTLHEAKHSEKIPIKSTRFENNPYFQNLSPLLAKLREKEAELRLQAEKMGPGSNEFVVHGILQHLVTNINGSIAHEMIIVHEIKRSGV